MREIEAEAVRRRDLWNAYFVVASTTLQYF